MKLRILAVTAAAAALMSAAPAQAQIFGNWGRDDHYRADARRVAYDNGYQRGLERGEHAAHDRKAFDLEREKDYRNGDWGYRGDYGNKGRYRDEFRRGFAEGYHQAYGRYGAPRYDNRYPAGAPVYGGGVYGGVYPNGGRVWDGSRGAGFGINIAFHNGESDGYQKGRDDARSGRYPQAERQKWYRSGDHNYNGHDGLSRDQYKNEYRRGFQQGYARAFNEFGRR